MGVRARIADGAMAGTAWNAGLRPASRGSAKPGRMTRRQANVSAAPFSCPAGCAEDPIMDVSPGGSRHGGPQGRRRFLAVRLYWVSVRSPQRCERFCHSQVRITPNAGMPDEKEPPRNRGSFPSPACGGLCRGSFPSPASLAGCAGRRPAQFSRWGLQAVPAVVVAGGRRSLAGGAITMVGVPVKPALSWQPAGGRCPLSDTPSRHSAPALHA